jgi:hypothetical protein
MSKIDVDVNIAFEILFSESQLLKTFESRHSDSQSRGIDRRNGQAFANVAALEVAEISKKCLNGEYRFTPYLESLKVKDRYSNPRLISIPAIRDRIVLSQLNKLIRLAFPDESKTFFASELVRDISEHLGAVDAAKTWTAGSDIRKFYDSIDRNRLRKIVDSKLAHPIAASLILRAVHTPTVPKTYRRKDLKKFHSEVGVPQGLAISNALAAIYLYEVDQAMKKLPVKYYRFVDDVLVIGSKDETLKAVRSFGARVRARGLATHRSGDKKSHHQPLSQSFGYLGYVFKVPEVTVRDSTVERLLQSLASKITDYKYNKARTLARKSYLTPDTLRSAFLDELNERVSGAISGKRRYGWIAYFSQLSDESVLHKIDAALRGMLIANADLAPHAAGVKRFSRALFEMRHRPSGGYVRDYDKFQSPVQMLKFLVFRGQVDGSKQLTEAEIVAQFETYKAQQLSAMLADEAAMY